MASIERSLPLVTYGQALDGLCGSAMTLIRRISDEMKRKDGEARLIGPDAMIRQFIILSALVRRAIMVSRHLEARNSLSRAPKIGLLATLEIVLSVFAKHKIDLETYNSDMDAIIEAEEDDFSDIPGCRPVTLIAELLRDFGMAASAVPSEWLEGVPSDFRLLAARTAAAAIRPSHSPARIGHVMER